MDIQYLLMLQNLREATGGIFNNFFTFITNIAVDFYIVIIAAVLFWAVSKRKATIALFSFGISLFLNAFLKLTFCVYRPWIRSNQIHPAADALPGATGYSFPSGHSSSAGGMYSGLIAAYRKNKGMCLFFAFMILITMFSRNFLGVHTPQDVVVGALIGIAGAVISVKVLDYAEHNPKKDWLVLVISTVLVVVLLIYISVKSYPRTIVNGELLVDPVKMAINGFKDPGVAYGVILGWFLNKRFVTFDETSGTAQQKVFRCMIGALILAFYLFAIDPAIGKHFNIGIIYFLLKVIEPLFIMVIYPMLCSRFEK